MRISILIRLTLGLGIALFIFASALRASLEDILAPLPVAELAPVSRLNLRSAENANPPRASVDKEQPVATRAISPDAILVSDLRSAITEKIEGALRPAGKLTLVPLRDLPDLASYSQPFNVKIVSMPSQLSRGGVLVGFQVENEKGVLGEWSIPFRVHLFSEVWYPSSHLRRGELATASDFEIGQVDLLVEPDAVPAQLESLLRHEYSRDIRPGKPLIWADLVQRSLVRKNAVVEVSAVNGLLAITMRAVAREDGSQGDLILLRNIDSAREFSARVIGENRVEVIF